MAHRLPLADIQFIADFAAFARAKGDEEYDYEDVWNCACCQFLKHTARAEEPIVGGDRWSEAATYPWVHHEMPVIDAPALWGGPKATHTFSALADRLEALIADAPVVERGQ